MKREEMYKAYMKVENFTFFKVSEDVKIEVVKREDITEFYREIVLPAFDYIESIESRLINGWDKAVLIEENKKLKEKLSDVKKILDDNCSDGVDNYQTIKRLENLLLSKMKEA